MYLKNHLAVMYAIHSKHKGSFDVVHMEATEQKIRKWLSYLNGVAIAEMLYSTKMDYDLIHSWIAQMSTPHHEEFFLTAFDEMEKFIDFSIQYFQLYVKYGEDNFQYLKERKSRDAEIEPFIMAVLHDEYDVEDDPETPLIREEDFNFIFEQVNKILE